MSQNIKIIIGNTPSTITNGLATTQPQNADESGRSRNLTINYYNTLSISADETQIIASGAEQNTYLIPNTSDTETMTSLYGKYIQINNKYYKITHIQTDDHINQLDYFKFYFYSESQGDYRNQSKQTGATYDYSDTLGGPKTGTLTIGAYTEAEKQRMTVELAGKYINIPGSGYSYAHQLMDGGIYLYTIHYGIVIQCVEQVLYTNQYKFENQDIYNLTTENQVDVIGDELVYDTMEADVYCTDTNIKNTLFGEVVYLYTDNNPKGKYYIQDVERIGKNKYRLNCFSFIGLLEDKNHKGDLYGGQTVQDVLDDILLDTLYKPAIYVEGVSDSPYSFEVDINGHYVSNCHEHNGFAISRVYVYNDSNQPKTLTVFMGNNSEDYYDYGIIGNIGQILARNNTVDVDVALNTRGYSNYQDVDLTIPGQIGWHFFEAKYRKDHSTSSGNDTSAFYISPVSLRNFTDVREYEIDSDLAETKVFGWLPYDTGRNNLHKLMMAYNMSIVRGSNPFIPKFCFLGKGSTTSIDRQNTFLSGKVSYGDMPTLVTITEHNFQIPYNTTFTMENDNPSKNYELVYDNNGGQPIYNEQIALDKPYYRYAIDPRDINSISIVEYGTNYIVLTGCGRVYGCPYGHTTSILSLNTGIQGKENVKDINNDCLITLQNSRNVYNRLKAYYGSVEQDSVGIKLNGESCGHKYNYYNCYDEAVNNALMTHMTVKYTGGTNLKGTCELASGIDYVGDGGIMKHSKVISYTGSSFGTWTVPSSWPANTPIKVVLIGGGKGGSSGYAGYDGGGLSSTVTPGGSSSGFTGNYDGFEGGEGGKQGSGGTGGKIYIYETTVTPGESGSWNLGQGGAGGTGGSGTTTTANRAGDDGTATSLALTASTRSSSYGYISENGFKEIFTDSVYGKNGNDGCRGGKGGRGMSYNSAEPAEDGEAVTYNGTTYAGGTGNNTSGNYSGTYAGGGGGAGGIVGGYTGRTPSYVYPNGFTPNLNGDGRGGFALNGVAPQYFILPIVPAQAGLPGSGGTGGHGGAGAGGHGYAINQTNAYLVSSAMASSKGGYGGTGGQGAYGCVIIYSPYPFD